jgi:D-sedoheptulose 7-phosphate isomerase
LRESEIVTSTLSETIALHERVKHGDLGSITRAAEVIIQALGEDGRLLTFGNGGSAADAQHVASELVGRFLRQRRSLSAIALTTDSSVLTSVANDESFDRVFARQIEGLGRPGDVVLGISTSGRSPNVIAGFAAARAQGLRTIALTGGDGGAMGPMVDVHVNVPSTSTPRVQEVHRTLLHVICDLVERAFVERL